MAFQNHEPTRPNSRQSEPERSATQIVTACRKHKNAILLAVDQPAVSPQILKQLNDDIGAILLVGGFKASRDELSEIRIYFASLFEAPELGLQPFGISKMQEACDAISNVIDPLCSSEILTQTLGLSLIHPLMYAEFSNEDAATVRDVATQLVSSERQTCSYDNLRTLFAESILRGFESELTSPSIELYRESLGISSVTVGPVATTVELAVAVICRAVLQKEPVSGALWDTLSVSTQDLASAQLILRGRNGGGLDFTQIASWFVVRMKQIESLLEKTKSRSIELCGDTPQLLDRQLQDFAEISSRFKNDLRIFNTLSDIFDERETDNDLRKALTFAAKGQLETVKKKLEGALGSALRELIESYVALPVKPQFPRDLVVEGLSRTLELFQFYFDEKIPGFYDSVLLKGIRAAIDSSDFKSAVVIRMLFPHPHSSSSWQDRDVVDNFIAENQVYVLEKLGSLCHEAVRRIDVTPSSHPQRIENVEWMLDLVKIGVSLFLTPKTFSSSDIGIYEAIVPLVRALIISDIRALNKENLEGRESPLLYRGTYRASDLLSRFPPKLAKSILQHTVTRHPQTSTAIAKYVMATNFNFGRELPLLADEKITMSEISASYEQALAAEQMYLFAGGLDSALPTPLITELRSSLTPLDIGLQLHHRQIEVQTPKDGLPHVMEYDLEVLHLIARGFARQVSGEERRRYLFRFYHDVCNGVVTLPTGKSEVVKSLLQAVQEYAADVSTYFRDPHIIIKPEEQRSIFSCILLPLTIDLSALTSRDLAPYSLSLMNLFTTSQAQEVFGKDLTEEVASQLRMFALATLLPQQLPECSPRGLLESPPIQRLRLVLGMGEAL